MDINTQEFDFLTMPLEGTGLIEAGAGTGKTYTIALLVLRLILEKNLGIDTILTVTFTEAATAELKLRIAGFLRQALEAIEKGAECEKPIRALLERVPDREGARAHLRDAVLRIDEAAIFTIHGFCNRVLSDQAFETRASFSIKMQESDEDLRREVSEDFWRARVLTLPPLLYSMVAESLSPDTLLNALRVVMNHPRIQIKTEENKANPEKAWKKMKETWEKSQKEVRDFLENSPDLKRNKDNFKKEVLPVLFAGLERLLKESRYERTIFRKFSQKNVEEQTKSGKDVFHHPFFEACEFLVDSIDRFVLRLTGEYLKFARYEIAERKRRLGLRSFGDLITGLYDALTGPLSDKLMQALNMRYRAALVDEFQDTDHVQYEIFKKIFRDKPFFMIGDPKQAIYRFRGGDIFAYLKAAEDADARYTLQTNYRSQCALLSAMNRIFDIPNPFIYEGIGYQKLKSGTETAPLTLDDYEPPPLVIVSNSGGNSEEEKSVVDEIIRLISGSCEIGPLGNRRKLVPSDIAILVKSNSRGQSLKKALVKRGISTVVSRGDNVFQSDAARNLRLLIRAVVEPSDETLTRALLLSVFFQKTAKEVNTFQEEEEKWQTLLERLRKAHSDWVKKGAAFALEVFFDSYSIYSFLIGQNDGERLLTDLRHLLELLHAEETRLGKLPFRLLARFEERMSEATESETEQRLESDEDAVNIITIHKSKGLQYPVVFIPYFRFSLPQSNRIGVIYHSPEDNKTLYELRADKLEIAREAEKTELLAEQRRQFYVALTRAEYRAYCYCRVEKATAVTFPFLRPWVEGEKIADEIEVREQEVTAEEHHIESKKTRRGIASAFERKLMPSWGVESYSSLVRPLYHSREISGLATGMFAFPRGARSGEALHTILEKLDFRAYRSESALPLIRETLEEFQIDGDANVVNEMLGNVLYARLGEDRSFCLAELSGAERVHEMEFYLSAVSLDIASIKKLLENRKVNLKEEAEHGFLKGYIDLLFRARRRYYIIDWKSNHLGNCYEDYEDVALGIAMEEHQYIFQLYLYSTAVYRFLKSRVPNFDYERDFGGAYYVFLRGVRPDPESRSGLYFEKPPLEIIRKLDAFFDTGGSDEL